MSRFLQIPQLPRHESETSKACSYETHAKKKKDRLSYREREKRSFESARGQTPGDEEWRDRKREREVSLQLDKWTAEKKSLPQQWRERNRKNNNDRE
jgi:hypothetical protein